MSANSHPNQLSLPEMPPPPFAPRWPNPGTLDDIALRLFLEGEYLNVEWFRQLTDSTRLPASVERLKRLHWPLEKVIVPEPSRRRRDRTAAVFFLRKQYIQQLGAKP